MTSSSLLLAGVVLAALVGGCETRAVDVPVDARSTPAVDAAIADAGVTQDAALPDAAPADAMADNSLLADISNSQVALDPPFDPAVTDWRPRWQYNLFDQGSFTIPLDVKTQDPAATLTMNGGPATVGHASIALPFTLGQQTVVSGPPPLTVVVTSADGRTSTTYHVQFWLEGNVP